METESILQPFETENHTVSPTISTAALLFKTEPFRIVLNHIFRFEIKSIFLMTSFRKTRIRGFGNLIMMCLL